MFSSGAFFLVLFFWFVFLLFFFVASKILTGNRGIPHFELWTRLGSSFSSSYLSFSSSSSPFPRTKVAGGRGGHFLDPYWASPSAAGQPRFNLLVAVPSAASPSHPTTPYPHSPLPPPPPSSPLPPHNPPCVCLAVCKSHWDRGQFALAVKSGRGLPLAGQTGP